MSKTAENDKDNTNFEYEQPSNTKHNIPGVPDYQNMKEGRKKKGADEDKK